MKKFAFRLERVRQWREAQVRLEESNLGRLRASVHALDQEMAAVAAASDAAAREILAAGGAGGGELEALGAFRDHAVVRTMELTLRRAEAQKAVDQQIEKVTERRREARLLDRLRERRFEEWQMASEREWDQQAAENYLLRWNR